MKTKAYLVSSGLPFNDEEGRHDANGSESKGEKASVPNGVVDALVRELNDFMEPAAVERARRMGQLIVTRNYGGDLAVWRRHTTKEASFRKLAARAENVLGLTKAHQRQLLAAAPENGWRTARLEQQASRLRRRLPKRTARVPVLAFGSDGSKHRQAGQPRPGNGDGGGLREPVVAHPRPVYQAFETAKTGLEHF